MNSSKEPFREGQSENISFMNMRQIAYKIEVSLEGCANLLHFKIMQSRNSYY